MEKQVDISVITINYNGLKDTCEFLDSWIKRIKSVSYELIVVDNASKEDEASVLETKYPQVQVIRSEQNLGFAGANNLGIDASCGKYLFFLNNDVLMSDDHIPALIKRLESDKLTAGVSPLILNPDALHTIQWAGYTPLSTITLRNHAIGEGSSNKKAYPAAVTPYLHGAAMLMKRSIIQKVGKMPEEYFLYYEELDWCTYITHEGYNLWYEPACEIIHKASQTTGIGSPLQAFYMSRNRLLYAYRNMFSYTFYLTMGYLLGIVLPVNYLRAKLHKQNDTARAHVAGVKAFFELKKKYD